MPDPSNGYEANAEEFMRCRSPRIGQSVVRDWAKSFAPGTQLLELGCGDGVMTEVLVPLEDPRSAHCGAASRPANLFNSSHKRGSRHRVNGS